MRMEIMHKDDLVAVVEIDKRGFISNITDICRNDLLPCIYSENESDLKIGLQRWMLGRCIGRTRKDIAPIKAFYGPDIFKSKNMVSLFDSYWLRENEDESWDKISPYKHWDYEDDCYFELLNDPENTTDVDNISPNLTIPGNDIRFWYKNNGVLGIITESSQKDMKIYKKAKELGIEKFVSKREYIIIHGIIYSFHPVETSENVERIPFDILYDSTAREDLKKIENLKICCDKYHLDDWKNFMGAVMKIDSELGNKGRNLCEIGVLRDTDTLKILGFEKI